MRRSRRRLALLGGTTTWADCMVGLRYLADPLQLVEGPAIARYERAFARSLGVRHALAFSAGRVGFYGLLRALGVGPGDDVLLQVPTHVVVANAIRYTGARPVYVDCRLDSYNMDLEQAERRITPATRVLLLQHTFGIPADLDAAMALAQRHGLTVIEDCVHSLGAAFRDRPVGSFGRAAFFSTEETKTISSTMGGMVATDDGVLEARLRAFQAECARPSVSLTVRYVLKLVLYHLLTQPRLHRYARAVYERVGERHPLPRPTAPAELRGLKPAGFEQRFSNAQAVLALRQLGRLERNVRHRAAVAAAYRERLSLLGYAAPLVPAAAEPSYVRYPVWVGDRATAVRTLSPHTVVGTWFTSVLEEAITPSAGDYELGSCPRAELATTHLVNLPTHERVTQEDVRSITSSLSTLGR